MDVVALVSGGKDSCFAMLECKRMGHNIVCLGHIAQNPDEDSLSEANTDSFMYQYAASEAVDAIAAALELPLVRVSSSGVAQSKALHYLFDEESTSEEVEALKVLLDEVREQFPSVKAVCSGAILSTYQRTRIESVCARLGLISLSFLWQRQQDEVFDAIVDSGIDAVLVKTAAVGLEPEKHLGKSLRALRGHFQRLHELYDFHICGEGGEYETFTLDSPMFRKRIVFDETEVLSTDANAASLRVLAYHLEDKAPAAEGDDAKAATAAASAASDRPIVATEPDEPGVIAGRIVEAPGYQWRAKDFFPYVHLDGDIASVDSISGADALEWATHFPEVVAQVWPSDLRALAELEEDVERQVAACLALLSAVLASHGMDLKDTCYVRLSLRSMEHFSKGNSVYCKFFGVHPPSRSCVELPIAPPDVVTADALVLRGSYGRMLSGDFLGRYVLHVQSISHWAPTCIGPYSQAQVLGEHLYFLAGQIGLVPGSMSLPETGAQVSELDLCFRHCAAILDVLPKGGASVAHALHFLLYASSSAEAGTRMGKAETARFVSLRAQARMGSGSFNAGYPRKSLVQKEKEDALRREKAMASFTGRMGFPSQALAESEEEEDEAEEGSREEDPSLSDCVAPFAVVFLPVLPRKCSFEVEMQALSELAYGRYKPERHRDAVQLELAEREAGGGQIPWPQQGGPNVPFGRAAVDFLHVPGVLVFGNASASFSAGEGDHGAGDLVSLVSRCAKVLLSKLRGCRLARKHLHQLRIFVPSLATLSPSLVRQALRTVRERVLRDLDDGAAGRPAVSVLPCDEVYHLERREDVLLQIAAYDLRRLDADMWVHDGGHV